MLCSNVFWDAICRSLTVRATASNYLLLRMGYFLQDIKFNVHTHPTLSEVLDELFKEAHVDKVSRPDPKTHAAPREPVAV